MYLVRMVGSFNYKKIIFKVAVCLKTEKCTRHCTKTNRIFQNIQETPTKLKNKAKITGNLIINVTSLFCETSFFFIKKKYNVLTSSVEIINNPMFRSNR